MNNNADRIADKKADMDSKNIVLTVGGEKLFYPEGTSYYQIAQDYETAHPEEGRILLVSEGNRLRELRSRAKYSSELSFIRFADDAGHRAYQRSATLMMLRALADVTGDDPRYACTVHFIVSSGLYCTLTSPELVTEELLQKVEARMEQMRDRKIRIEKRNVSTAQAIRVFHENGMDDKERLFAYRLNSRTNIYDIGGYVDYYYGYMLYDTSYVELFSLQAYRDGFVLCIPDTDAPDRLPAFDPVEKLFDVQNESLKWGSQLAIFSVADLNDAIVRGGAKDLILTQEAYDERQIADIARSIVSDPAKRIVMIAGPSSSSKTTFSHRLSTQLSVYGMTPHPIPVDDYFVDREKTPRDANGNYNFECLEAIDVEQFNQDMNRLLAGERVSMPAFNFKTGKREYKGKYLQLGSNDILVIEGIHGLNDKLSYSLPRENKFRIYISALTQLNVDAHNRISTTDGRMIRRIVRDARTRGNSAQHTIAMWHSVRSGEEHYIFPFQESADVMFNSALIYELAVLKIYAEPLLFSVDRNSPEYTEAKRLLKFLDYFVPIPSDDIPANSLVREFIGGSCFDV